jgi:HlyD family secretion protein
MTAVDTAQLTSVPLASPRLNTDLRRPGLFGGLAFLVLVFVLGGWATMTRINGAVVAGGQVEVHGQPRQVQSLDGGIVESIHVQNGDVVTEGQILMRLDPTLLAVNLDIARSRLAAALTLRARLEAEQTRQESLVFTYPPLPFAMPDVSTDEAGQREIFAARAAVLQGQRDQLAEAQLQFDAQSQGIAGQIAATRAQMDYLTHDIENQQTLVDQGLARQSQLNDLQRGLSDLTGQLAGLEAEQARLATARRESILTTLQAERAFMESVVTDLREATTKTEELILDIVTRSAQLDRIEIRAPADGIVHEMEISTVGGVVAPGSTILQIVPLSEGLEFELRIDPRAIDQVHPGQRAEIIIASFDPQSTPRLAAEVSTISAGAVADPRTGQSFYRVGLTIAPAELARLGDAVLMPGMPVEAFLETGDRSVLAYLLQPVTNHLRHAFRE